MKKLIAVLLSLCILIGMPACSSSDAPQPTQAATNPPEPPAVTEPEPVETEPPETEPAEATLEEVVVYDDGTFKLTAKEIDYSDSREIQVKFLAENNSDKSVSFVGNDFTINGITIYGNFYIDVAAGKKANGSLNLDLDDLSYVGIEEIATITAQDIFIYNNDDRETITHLTFSLETSIANDYNQEIDRSGELLYERDGIRVLYRGLETNWMDEPVLSVLVENTSDVNCSILVDDVSVNGFMVYANMSAPAYSDTVTYNEIDFSSSDLEESGIDAIEEVCFKLWAYDDDNNTTLWRTEEITVSISSE